MSRRIFIPVKLCGMTVEQISALFFKFIYPSHFIVNDNQIHKLCQISRLETLININNVNVSVSIDRERREMLFTASFDEGQSSEQFEEMVDFYRKECDCYREGNSWAAQEST